MNRNGWDTGDRRTDVYIVLLLAAVYLRDAVPSSEVLLTSTPSIVSIWRWCAELTGRFGFLVPLAVAGGMLTRLMSVRVAVLLLAAYAVSAFLPNAVPFVVFVVRTWWVGWHLPLSQTLWLLQWFWIKLADAALPILTAVYLCRACVVSPRWTGARFTRLICVVLGVVQLISIGLSLAAPSITLPYFFGTVVGWGTGAGALGVLLAALLTFSGARLIRGDQMARGWIWSSALAAVAMTSVAQLDLLAYVLASLYGYPVDATRSLLAGVGALRILAASTVAAVILWYWWPALRGRVGPELEPDMPHCPTCGYCVYGIASPRCPECGEPLPATGSAAPEPRTTV